MGNTLFGGAAKVSAGGVSAAAAAVLQVLVASRRPRCHEHGAEDQQGELLSRVTRDTCHQVQCENVSRFCSARFSMLNPSTELLLQTQLPQLKQA